MTNKKKLRTQDRATSFWKKCQRHLPQGLSKNDLRRQLADAIANTPASSDSATAVRLARQERQA